MLRGWDIRFVRLRDNIKPGYLTSSFLALLLLIGSGVIDVDHIMFSDNEKSCCLLKSSLRNSKLK